MKIHADTFSYFLNDLNSRNAEKKENRDDDNGKKKIITNKSSSSQFVPDTVTYFLNDLKFKNASKMSSYENNRKSERTEETLSPTKNIDTLSYFLNDLVSKTVEKRKRVGVVHKQKKVTDSLPFGPSNLKMVGSREEFDATILRGTDEYKMVVVKFYGTWCKACKAMQPLFRLLVSYNTDVLFVDVAVSSRASFVTSDLGVKSFPFGQIYVEGAGLVEQMIIDKNNFSSLVSAIGKYYKKP